MVRKIRLQDILRLLPLLLIYFAIWTWTSFYIVRMLLGYQHLTQLNEKQPPLPNDLAGLLLPYGHCGNDLDFSEKTIDVELTKLSVFSNRFIPFPAIYKYAKHDMDAV